MIYSSTLQIDQLGEIRGESNRLGYIIDYVKKHSEVRVNIQWAEKDSIDVLQEQISILSLTTTNYTISCDNFHRAILCHEKGMNAYFNFPVTDWETFEAFQARGMSDILIDGPLGFQMKTINRKKDKTLIRVRPQRSNSASICVGDNENTFFIRPEDLALYEPYVDICEIITDNKEKEQVLYNIYKRRSFNGDLSVLVTHLHKNVLNPFVHSDFAKHRVDCGQRCKSGSSCHLCHNYLDLTETVVDHFQHGNPNVIEIK